MNLTGCFELGITKQEIVDRQKEKLTAQKDEALENLQNIIQEEQFQSRLEGRIEARLKAIQQSAISVLSVPVYYQHMWVQN